MTASRLTWHRLAVPILLGCGILATLAREIVFANYFGVSRDLEIFRVAFALPNMLSQSFAPAYIGALLPVLALAAGGNSADFEVFCRRLAHVSFAGILLLTIIGILTIPPQASVMAPGFDDASRQGLIVALALCWGFFFLTGLSFLPRLFLNKRQEFWPGSSTSLVISLCLVAASIVAAANTGFDDARLLASGTILAGGLILLVHTVREPQPFKTLRASLRRAEHAAGSSRQAIIGPIVLVLLLLVVNALPRFIDRAVGSEIAPGTVAALEYSFNILTVPGILLGTSLITVFYPAFVQRVQDRARADIGKTIGLPVAAALVAALILGLVIHHFAIDLTTLVYARGAFTDAAVQSTSTLLSWHGLGLGFMVAAMVLLQACLAYRVFSALLLIAAVRILSKWLAVVWLVPRYGLDGLGASFIVPEIVSTVLLAGLLYRSYRAGPG